MGKRFSEIGDQRREFIEQQKMFFVGTADSYGRVNVSPKGMDSLKVMGDNRVVWLNMTGSGNETAAHLVENDRMNIMFCAFEGSPMILRLFGHAKVIHPRDSGWDGLFSMFRAIPGARQIMDMQVDLVQGSWAWPYRCSTSTIREICWRIGPAERANKTSTNIGGTATR